MSSPEIKRRSPYQGLIPYGEQDAPFFFGREKETRLIIANLFASPLTLLYGASGVGKSSVLRAGVTHELRDRDNLLVVPFNSWQSNPVADLVQAIADRARLADPAAWAAVQSLLPRDSEATLDEMLTICAAQLKRRMMIILDQFEEYFLYHPQDDEFAAEFCRAVTKPEAPVSFLISIREDFYAKLDRFEGRIPALYDNYLRIEHLDRKAARIAIEKPIGEYNRLYAGNGQFSIEPELVAAVLKQVETGQVIIGEAGRGVIEATAHEDAEAQIETPFLQLVMTRLWEKEVDSRSHRLRLETLEGLGGAENIVRTHLDAVISKLTADEQEVAANIFHYLVTPSGTKIAYTASDLAGSAELSEAEVVRVLEKLSHGDVRILRPVDPTLDRPGAPRYEIFHDVLAPAILTWRTAYVQAQERADAERRAEEQQRRADEQARVARRLRRLVAALAVMFLLAMGTVAYAFTQRANAQANARRADAYAEDSKRLRQQGELLSAQGTAAEHRAQIAQHQANEERKRTEEQIKIAELRKAEAEKAQHAAQVATQRAGTANVAAKEATIAAQEQARATRIGYSNLLAVQSRVTGDEYSQRSLLLAVEALNQPQPGDPPVPAAENALRQALSRTGGLVFLGHDATVNHVGISPNNRWLVSEDEAGVTYIRDLNATDSMATPHRLQGASTPLEFSNDDRWLATGSRKERENEKGNNALLWDLKNLADPPRKLAGHNLPVNSVVISLNNRWLVSGTRYQAATRDRYGNDTARLWDLTATDPGAKPILLPGGNNYIVGISRDSHWLITESRDEKDSQVRTFNLWDLTAPNPIAKSFVLSGHEGRITTAVTSPDGHWLATSSTGCGDKTDTDVRLWNLTAANPSSAPVVLKAHERSITSIVFSTDSKRLVTSGRGTGLPNCPSDPNSFLWDLTQPNTPPVNIGTIDKPIGLGTLEDQFLLITQPDESKNPRVYLLEDKEAIKVLDIPESLIAASSDYQILVTRKADVLQNVKQLLDIRTGGKFPFQPLSLWNLLELEESREPLSLTGHEGGITAASFSNDNSLLVTGGEDHAVRLWNLSSSSINAAPLKLKDSITKYALDRNRWLATRGREHTVKAWDLSALDPAAKPIVLRGHEKDVDDFAVSPDGRWLATRSADGTVRLWDMSAANPSANQKILRDSPSAMAFSPDNRWLATGSTAGQDVTIHMWEVLAADPSNSAKVWTTEISAAYLSPDNHWLIDFDHRQVWDMSNREFEAKSMDLKVDSVTVSPDGDWLVSSKSGTSTLRNLHDKHSAATIDLKAAASPFVFSPDHRWLFTNSDSKPTLWDLKAAHPAPATLILPDDAEESIKHAVFSADGKWLALSDGGIVLLWNLRNLNSKPVALTKRGVESMDISDDSRWLVTSHITDVTMWDLTAGNPAAAAVTLPLTAMEFFDVAVFSRYDRDRQWLILLNTIGDNAGRLAIWNTQSQSLSKQACRTAGRNLSESEWKEYFPDKPYRKTCPNLPAGK